MVTWRTHLADGAAASGPVSGDAPRVRVLRSGLAVMLAFAATYAACSALVAAFPEASVKLLNALFHGVDFGKLGLDAGGFSLSRIGIGAALWAAKGFVFGAVFAAIYNALGRWAAR